MTKLKDAFQVVNYYGVGFCFFRVKYALQKKVGYLKHKCRSGSWEQIRIEDILRPGAAESGMDMPQIHESNKRRFFFDSDSLPKFAGQESQTVVSQADNILDNRFCYFFDKWHLLGPEPDWFFNPLTGRRAKSDLHWSEVNLSNPDFGDIKFVWEPSRFAWVYTLVRAFAATGEMKYPEKFWSLFESWLEANQPNTGPNYACGQECAIRLMAMCFALYAFARLQASSTDRKNKLITAIWVHADRIEKNIDFAISTRTNHSLTEAAGLYTAGLLFPEFDRSKRWRRLGKRVLTNEALKQIYRDGSYIQHSMNYHRLMLQDLLWVLRLAELNDASFSAELMSRCKKATCFLYQMQDEVTGHVPNYGSNDGALIVPLNSCGYLDFRPVVQAMYYMFTKKKLYEKGPWDEDLFWFFGPEAADAPIELCEREDAAYPVGGYYSLRNKNSWSKMRCHTYSDRPGQADMLHLDLWWRGINVLRDSGTYTYDCRELLYSYFVSTAAHNTITVNGIDQMTKGPRFTWFDWTKSKLFLHCSFEEGSAKIMQGEHYGYGHGHGKDDIVHRRSVLSLADNSWVIVDDVLGTDKHNIRLHWQLCNAGYDLEDNSLALQTKAGPVNITVLGLAEGLKCEVLKADKNRPAGWQSLYYGRYEPSPVLICSQMANLPTRLVTLIILGDVQEHVSWGENRSLSWTLRNSGRKYVVGLNSIDVSQSNSFIFVQVGPKKIILNK
ncbi:MAG: heparinase [Planctomycetes bacterium]|nr:heparinase [Planctomycetota bacterium]